MKALKGLPLVRHMFPELRLSALGAVLCAFVLGLLAFAGRIPRGEVPLFFLQGAALVAGGWWLLMAAPLCLLACRMAPLRLPGIGRILRRGVLLHLALSIGLPLGVLCWWLPPGVDALALAAALWLGSATGWLIVSMPMAVPVVPLAILLADGALLADPVGCGLLGALALCLSGLAWRWQLGRSQPALWAPTGVALAGSPLQLLRLAQQLPEAHGRADPVSPVTPDARMEGRDLLAALLGPSCQTLRQLYGRRGRWWVYLVLGGTTLALLAGAGFWPPDAAGGGVFLAAATAGLLPMLATRPAARLAHLQRHGLAELQLTPGMPAPARLPEVLMRQMLCCLGERLALAALALAGAVGLAYEPRAGWLGWWAGLAGLSLAHGLASAWLAWRGHGRSRWWLGVAALAPVLAIFANVHMLAHGRPLTVSGLVLGGAWVLLAGLVCLGLSRPSVPRRPAQAAQPLQ